MGHKKIEKHERMYGPHFNEAMAMKAISKMQNEDGTIGQHWSLPETTQLANRYGISLSTERFNKYDWFVALNMVYSDYCAIIRNIQINDPTKFFVELAKYWIKDKDVDEGKMWYYFKYVMCDEYHEDYEDDDDDDAIRYTRRAKSYRYDDYDDYDDYNYRNRPSRERITSRY